MNNVVRFPRRPDIRSETPDEAQSRLIEIAIGLELLSEATPAARREAIEVLRARRELGRVDP
jgi:hypothetical protein